MLNRDDDLFLTLKCRKCETRYVFWRDMKVKELEEYEFRCCSSPDMRGELFS